MAPYKILKQGYIEKEPPVSKRGLRKKLVRYWFVLVEDKKQVALVYFKNEDQYIARQRNEGFIRIDEALNISVVGEHMGRKHAFVIKTPKGEYVLAPESRYDLHEWLFTLHNALEVFKKKQEKLRQRQGARPRANTADSAPTRPQQGATAGPHRTPPHTPTRRAPPPPTGRGSAQRRRPNRPAPGPPPSHSHNGELPQQQADAVYHPLDDETPPPSYTESETVVLTQDTLSAGEVADLNISQVDNDIHEPLAENEPPPVDDGGPYPFNEPDPLQERTNLTHQTSSSMPDLLTHSEDTPATTPDNERTDEQGQDEDSPPETRLTAAQFQIRHTRHHSLTLTEIKSKKKRSSRRQGSLKLRSRSPPELPPPPPPEGEVPASPTPLEAPPQAKSLQASEPSTASLGFSGVMDTITDIEQQLDEMSDEFSPRPTIPAPVRGSVGETVTVGAFQFSMIHTPSPVLERPEGDNFNEEEWLCDDPTMEPRPPPAESHGRLMDEVRQSVLASPESAQVETVPPTSAAPLTSVAPLTSAAPPTSAATPTSDHHRKGKQVMFKEEVEDIPNTYEPVADGSEDSGGEEEVIPSSVAELKKRLFGEREVEAARYKREGPLSPKYTHPFSVTFDEGYKFQGQSSRELSPNANNNNSGGETEIVRGADESNVYDKPWDLRPTASREQKDPSPPPEARKQKEPTPPPVAPKPVASPLHTKESGWSDHALPSADNESLLSSISSTLQETSKYGSDTLLNNYDHTPKKKPEVRFSSKGELEKIRAEHRRDPPPPPQGASPQASHVPQGASPQANHPHQGAPPQATRAPQGASPKRHGNSPQGPSPKHSGSPQATKKWSSPNHQKMNGQPGGSPNRNFVGPPRTAVSLDRLQDAKPNTQVTYDASTNSHIFRSLV